MEDRIQLDILLRGSRPIDAATVDTIDEVRPSVEDVEHCRRWLVKQGLVCHATDLGLVCEGNASEIRSVFGSATEPLPPEGIADYIAQVTVFQSPEYF
jgi:hypothetical protein